MAKPSLRRRIKLLTFLLLILTSTIITLSFLPRAKAETKIISISPSSGNVGTTVQLSANISTVKGEYVVQFDGENVTSGNAAENDVTASFTVPHAPAGSHSVTIVDVYAGENDTITFTVLTLYSLKIDVPEPPKQLQEGGSVPISVNITGGESSKTYVANVTVQAPTNASYKRMLNMTAAENGSVCVNLTYPNDFPTDANTNFTGEYKVFFNTTLATEQFTVGLTNSTEYHRFQFLDIKAAGYKPDENVTITISFEEEIVDSEENVTATEEGMIYANWTVFSNASIGIYTIKITSTSLNKTTKNPPDIQDFAVLGITINITTINLAEKPVPGVTVRSSEEGKSVVNGTSGADGLVTLLLEIGNYTCDAYFKNKKVGERWINVTGAGSWFLLCNLTSLGIVVVDEAGICIPGVKLYLAPDTQTLTTDINGMAFASSLLPNITYTLNASRYDTEFNTTTIPQLPTTDWINITIVCPTVTLQVNVTGVNNKPISNATVRVQDTVGGLHYSKTTDINGKAALNCTFGRYLVKVHVDEIQLNETTGDLLQNQNISIRCELYGLNVSVKVVDYFGQPFSNANVTLQREGWWDSGLTGSNGEATFINVIGGNMQVTVYLFDQTQPCVAATPLVNEPTTTIEIKIGRYIILAGFLVETSQLTTAIIIVVTITLILSIEVYRRKRFKRQKSTS